VTGAAFARLVPSEARELDEAIPEEKGRTQNDGRGRTQRDSLPLINNLDMRA